MQAVLRVDNVKVCKLKCIWDGAGLIMMDSWRGWTQYIYNLYKLASCIFQLENLKKQYKPNLVVELCNKYNRIIFILPPTQIFIRHLFRMIFLKVLWVPVLQTSQTMMGREEKSCLPSTEKKAAVDVDQQKRAGCTSTSTNKKRCIFKFWKKNYFIFQNFEFLR